MKVAFTPALIADLRKRVIAHNNEVKAIAANETDTLIKLGTIKGLYKRWYGGRDPHDHALALLDRHLAGKRAELATLAKAKAPFDPSEHPRSTGGEFAAGGGHQVRQVGLINRSSIDQSQGDGRGDPALLDAAQTQVIPETRFSVFGPRIAGAAMLGYYGYAGATATAKPTLVDRGIIAGLRSGGGKVGGLAGKVTGLAIHGAARGGIGAINRSLHTTLSRPSPAARQALANRLAGAGGKAGAAIGAGIGHAQSKVFQAPGRVGRKVAEAVLGQGRLGRVGGRAAGAVTSMAVLGGLMGGTDTAVRIATNLGPYLDAAFPRRVRKMAPSPAWDSPLVLAKRDAVLADEALQKAALSAGLNLLGRAAGRFVRTLRPSVASHSTGPAAAAASAAIPPITGAAAGAERVFGAQRAGFTVPPRIAGRALAVGGHVVPLAVLGGGTGALAGAAGVALHERFLESAHPRDPHGRFATKGQSAALGAKVGAAVGAGLGLAAGLVAARGGHTALLRQAFQRMGAAIPGMHTAAEAEARNAHARDFFAHRANRAATGDFRMPPGSEPTHDQVKAALEAHAIKRWANSVGAAIRGGPVSYYTHQLDQAFDKTAFAELRRVADRSPLVDKAGQAITGSSRNLFHTLDENKLSANQRKLWDDLVTRRQGAIDRVEGVYTARRAETAQMEAGNRALSGEKSQIEKDLNYVPTRLQDLEHESAPLRTIQAFAKDRLGYELKTPQPDPNATLRDLQAFSRQHFTRPLVARTKQEAVEEVHDLVRNAALDELKDEVPRWETRVNTRLDEIDRESTATLEQVKERRSLGVTDLSDAERMAIRNPFATGRQQFFDPMPDAKVAQAAAAADATRAFSRESDAHAATAREHLDHLIAAHEAHLQSGMAQGSVSRQFHRIAPRLAGRARQAMEDWAAISTAHRENLPPGPMRAAYDFVHVNKNPTAAYNSAARLSTQAGTGGRRFYQWAVRNAGALSTAAGLASAVGAYDIAAPPGKTRWNVNPFSWARPRNLRIERERPNPIDRPHEIALGLSYLDRDNQQKYLTGVYVHGKGNNDYSNIPYGVPVDQIRNQVRNRGGNQQGGGSSHQAQQVNVPDQRGLTQTINQLRQAGHINNRVGPAGAQYQGRIGGDGGAHAKAVAEGLYKQHVAYLETIPGATGNSNRRADRYWTSLKSLFEAPGTEILSPQERTALLIGGGPSAFKRGIFGNRNGALSANSSDASAKTAAATELMRQIKQHTPTNRDEYRQLNRGLTLVAERMALTPEQRSQISLALDKEYENATAQQAPRGADSEKAGSLHRAQQVAAAAVRMPQHERDSAYSDDKDMHEAAVTAYQAKIGNLRRMHPDWDEQQLHDEGQLHVLEQLRKGEVSEGLRKYLTYRPPATKVPGIAGLGQQPVAQGAPRPPRAGVNLASRIGASHQLGQAGTYGVATGLQEGGDLVADAVRSVAGNLPGGRVISAASRALPVAGSLAGVFGAAPPLRAAGRALGDRGTVGDARTAGESNARMGAGLAGSYLGQKLGHATADVGLRAAPRQVGSEIAGAARSVGSKIAGAARRVAPGLFQRWGATIGGDIGGVGGAIAGEAVEPAGGGVFGAWRGHALGAAVGAGAGWLADEGVGLLYRHLSQYGHHVPDIAAKTMGVPSAVRARHAKTTAIPPIAGMRASGGAAP